MRGRNSTPKARARTGGEQPPSRPNHRASLQKDHCVLLGRSARRRDLLAGLAAYQALNAERGKGGSSVRKPVKTTRHSGLGTCPPLPHEEQDLPQAHRGGLGAAGHRGASAYGFRGRDRQYSISSGRIGACASGASARGLSGTSSTSRGPLRRRPLLRHEWRREGPALEVGSSPERVRSRGLYVECSIAVALPRRPPWAAIGRNATIM